MRVEDFPLVMSGFKYLVPPGFAEDEISFVRFLDHRENLRGVGFGPNVDIMVMAEQIECQLGVIVQFRPGGQDRFYTFHGAAS